MIAGDVRSADGPTARAANRLLVFGLATVVGAVAVVARVVELRDVPRLTDETDEIMLGLAIARGEALPLTNVDAYIGPLWNYLVALGFMLAGPTSAVPRLLTVTVALLTVAATGWIGWEAARRLGWGRRAPAVALGSALLLAASSFHAIVSSRIGWSHALTPLVMALVMAGLLRWERLRDGYLLAGVGLGFGLAVHTHPTALAFGPGLLIWSLLGWRVTLAARAGRAAIALFVLAIAPLAAYNVATGFGSVWAAAQVQAAYAGGPAAGPTSYGGKLVALLGSWPLLLSGDIGEARGARLTLDDPVHLAVVVAAAAGLFATARARSWAPVLVAASSALVLPLVNGKYEPLFNGRYLAPLLPLGCALMAAGVAACCGTVARVSRQGLVERPLYGLAIVGLAAWSALALQAYVAATLRDGPNNRELYRAAEIVAAAADDRPVLLDATLSGTRQSTGREGTGVLEYLVRLDDGLAVRRLQPNDLAQAAERGEGTVVVVSPRLLARLDKEFVLEAPPGEEEARRRRRAGFMIARIVGPA